MMPQTHWQRGRPRRPSSPPGTPRSPRCRNSPTARSTSSLACCCRSGSACPNKSTRVYRLQTDDGERIIGRHVSPAWVAQRLGDGQPDAHSADAFAALLDGRTVLELADGLAASPRPRHGRVPHRAVRLHRRDGRPAHSLWPVPEIIAWKLRCSCRPAPAVPAILGQVMERYPLVASSRDAGGGMMPPAMPPNWRAVSRVRPRRCAVTISPTAAAHGRYWLVGDVSNTPGRSLCPSASGREIRQGAAGKWTDAATGEHGDLLDLIRESCGFVDFRECSTRPGASSACRDPSRTRTHRCTTERHLLPPDRPKPRGVCSPCRSRSPARSPKPICARAASRLCATAQRCGFIPRCCYRPDAYEPTETWPALIAAVTDLDGRITGRIHRTWLAPRRQRQGADRRAAARDRPPARHGVRFGVPTT